MIEINANKKKQKKRKNIGTCPLNSCFSFEVLFTVCEWTSLHERREVSLSNDVNSVLSAYTT